MVAVVVELLCHCYCCLLSHAIYVICVVVSCDCCGCCVDVYVVHGVDYVINWCVVLCVPLLSMILVMPLCVSNVVVVGIYAGTCVVVVVIVVTFG